MSFAAEYHSSFELCAYCPKLCRFACPVSEATSRESHTPWGKMSAAFYMLNDTLELSDAVQAGYACTGCGACTQVCDHDNDVMRALVALRSDAYEEEVASDAVTALVESYYEFGNSHGRSLAPVLDELVPEHLLDEEHETVFLPGCETLSMPNGGGLTDVVKIFEHLGGAAGVYPHDLCCGLPLYFAGAVDEFDEHAAEVTAAFEEYHTLIVGSASCAWALSTLYPERGHELAPKIVHVSEYVHRLLEENVLTLRRKYPGPVYYHDPCFLARRLEVTHAPRAVLERLVEGGVLEFMANQENTVCCGGEGGLANTMPDTAAAMARRRLEATEGISVVTACPRCVKSFTDVDGTAVDLVTVLAHCL